MIDSMFQDGTDKVLDDRVARPVAEPPARPSFGASLWNTTKAPFTGVAVAATERAAFWSDNLGAFGDVQAGYGIQADPALLFDSDMRERVQREGAPSRAAIESGAAFSSEVGTSLRATARTMMPDATTSNAAENVIFGLTRFGSKAIFDTLTMGPAGAVVTGADEGFVESAKLKAEGVDFETRTKAGVVAGGAAGAATVLPVAGKTVWQTVGLVAAGGPGGFIAQQAASRAILQNAGYDKIAEQYDPFDPVGLAVSTLIPAGFGAYASRGMRGARPVAAPVDAAAARELVAMGGSERQALRYDDARLDAYAVTAAQRAGVPPEVLLAAKNAGERSSSSAATSPVGAKGIMQFMDATWAQYGKGKNVRDPVASIDVGADFLADLGKQYGGDWRAALAHYNGGVKAGEAVRAGKAPPAAETRAYLERTDRFIAERQGTEAGRAAAADPEAVAAARVNLIRDTVNSWNLKDPADIAGAEQHLAAFTKAADQLGAGERVSISDTINLDNLTQARMLDDFGSRMEAARADLLQDAGNVAEPGAIRNMRDEINNLRQSIPSLTDEALRVRAKEIQAEGGSYKQALAAATKELTGRADEINQRIESLQQQVDRNSDATRASERIAQLDQQIADMREQRAAIDAPTPKRSALAVKQALAEPPAKGAKSGTAEAGTNAPESVPPTPKAGTEAAPSGTSAAETGTSGGQADATAAVLDSQTAEIARLSPNLMVQLEGMDAPMPLGEALAKVKEQAAIETKDAGLLQVAAECFLRNS